MTDNLRILIVDDSQLVRRYTRNVLEQAGFEVDEAVNGVEGIERLVSRGYDLVLVDINMAKMDGYEFVRTIRAEPHQVTTPVAMISSEHGDEDVQRAYQAGANLYLIKPVKSDTLRDLARFATGTQR